MYKKLIEWRRHFHMYPELSYKEEKTSNYIEEELKQLKNVTIKRLTPTSVYAELHSNKRGNNQKKILFRADIDALPIKEETGYTFESRHDGIMHACGHDVHTAILLGTVYNLSEVIDELDIGSVGFIFQHAEEVLPGGASELVEKGVLEDVDYAFALHIDPHLEVGKVSIKYDEWCAAADDFYITIHGKSSHASEPQFGIDPIIVGAEFVSNLQYIVSRKISPLKTPVISVTNFQTESATNVIPNQVKLTGTIRSLQEDSRLTARLELEKTLQHICEMHGASYELHFDLGYPPVTNHKDAVDLSRAALEKTIGVENIILSEHPMFGTEDFSAYSTRVPSSMQFLGVKPLEQEEVFPLHHPKLAVDEACLKIGVDYFTTIARLIK